MFDGSGLKLLRNFVRGEVEKSDRAPLSTCESAVQPNGCEQLLRPACTPRLRLEHRQQSGYALSAGWSAAFHHEQPPRTEPAKLLARQGYLVLQHQLAQQFG